MVKRYGADPEFFAGRGAEGRKYPAGRQPIRCPYGHRGAGEVGLDGDGFTGEFRPRPSDTIQGLMWNVARCVGQLTIDNHHGYPLLHVAPAAWKKSRGVMKAAGGHVHVAWRTNEPMGPLTMDVISNAFGACAAYADRYYPALSRQNRREGNYGDMKACRPAEWLRGRASAWRGTEFRGYNTWLAAPSIAYLSLKLVEETMRAGRKLTEDEMRVHAAVFKQMPRPAYWYDIRTQWWQIREDRLCVGLADAVDAMGEALSEENIVLLAAKKSKVYVYGTNRTRGNDVKISPPGDTVNRYGDQARRYADWWAVALPAERRESGPGLVGRDAAQLLIAAIRGA